MRKALSTANLAVQFKLPVNFQQTLNSSNWLTSNSLNYLFKLCIVCSIMLGCLLTSFAKIQNSVNTQNNLKLVDTLRKMLKQNWVLPLPKHKDTCTTIESLFDSLDRYTEFYNPEEYQYFKTILLGYSKRYGFRYQYLPDSTYFFVSEVVFGSPIWRAGLIEGDIIKEINGIGVKKITSNELLERIGEYHDSVTITYTRVVGNKETDNMVTVRKDRVLERNIPPMGILDGEVAYVKIPEFNSNTAADFELVVMQMLQNKLKKIIVDVRDNTGGLLEEAVKVADEFIPAGKLMLKKVGKNAEYQDSIYRSMNSFTQLISPYLKSSYYSQDRGMLENVEVVVLINRHTASAAEIFAGMLRKIMNVTLIGEPSFGKGIYQKVFPLYDSFGVKITLGEIVIGNDMHYDKWLNHDSVGLRPDIYCNEGVVTTTDSVVKYNLVKLIGDFTAIRNSYPLPDKRAIPNELKVDISSSKYKKMVIAFGNLVWGVGSIKWSCYSDRTVQRALEYFELRPSLDSIVNDK